jgi:hypothetical protein
MRPFDDLTETQRRQIREAHAEAQQQPARASKPRPVHLRSFSGGNNTKCGRGGVTFSAPITDDPAKATCKNCLATHAAIQRDHGRTEQR